MATSMYGNLFPGSRCMGKVLRNLFTWEDCIPPKTVIGKVQTANKVSDWEMLGHIGEDLPPKEQEEPSKVAQTSGPNPSGKEVIWLIPCLFSWSRVIYQFKYTQADCQKEYIGKSGRASGDRLKEHLRAPSPIYQHSQATGHPINVDCFSIVGREAHGVTKTVKEAMFIHVHGLSHNRNLGKYQYSPPPPGRANSLHSSHFGTSVHQT